MKSDNLCASVIQTSPGYKPPRAGLSPADWSVAPLGALVTKVGSGITPTGGAKVYKKGGRPFVRSQNVGWGRLLLDDLAFIDEETHRSFVATEINSNDVLLNITGASIGRSAVADSRLAGGNVNQHVCILRPDPSILDAGYLRSFLLSNEGQGQVQSFQAGGNRQGLNFGQIRSFSVPLPPLPEQRAIAEVLSDADDLISALDKLIAKKRAIKQGAMQQLLTGRTRLPVFCGEWEDRELGGLGSTYGGLTGKSKIDFSDGKAQYVPFMNVMSNPIIDVGDLAWVRVSPGEQQNTVKRGDILFNTSSETPDEVGLGSVLLQDVPELHLNSFCFGFHPASPAEIDGLFISYLFRSGRGREMMYALAQGATRYNLSKSNFLKLHLALPSLAEQRAIAGVLCDMDAEIAALDRRRDKTRLLKQGMMQELLTGRTRLI